MEILWTPRGSCFTVPRMTIKIRFCSIVCIFLSLQSWALDQASCAKTTKDLALLLTENSMKEKWLETTANDGKPLKIDISEKDGHLYFVFDKTNEGIWAEGAAEICKEDKELLLKVSGKDIHVGPKAPFPVRMSMSGGAKFRLSFKKPEVLHVSTFGWSGDFIPR